MKIPLSQFNDIFLDLALMAKSLQLAGSLTDDDDDDDDAADDDDVVTVDSFKQNVFS